MGGRLAWDFPATWDLRLVEGLGNTQQGSRIGVPEAEILAGGFAMSAVLLVQEFPHRPRGRVGTTYGCTVLAGS